ncbi:MAG: WG repeat-containing protein, partial [Clostridia bacterium]|nr:WG repeat-containing protein [Clostridia bacterium]
IQPTFDEAYDFDSYGKAIVAVDGKYGFINKNGEFITEPQFDNKPICYADGSSCVKNFLYGYADKDGTVIIEPKFLNKLEFAENGLAIARKDSLYGYIDITGEFVILPAFDECSDFTENGLACVKQNGKFGFIDRAGKYVIFPTFDEAFSFNSFGLACVGIDEKYGYINGSGEYIVPLEMKKPDRYAIDDFEEDGIFRINGKYGLVSTQTGELIVEAKLDDISPFSDGMARYHLYDPEAELLNQHKYGYIDASGNVMEPIYHDAGDFDNGLAVVTVHVKVEDKEGEVNDRWAFMYALIDRTGKRVTEPMAAGKLIVIRDYYYNGMTVVCLDGKGGYIDKSGKLVMDPKFDNAVSLDKNGLIKTEKNGKYGYRSVDGAVNIEPKFKGIYPCYQAETETVSYFRVYDNQNKAGLVDQSGEYVVKPIYEGVWASDVTGATPVYLNGKWGYVGKNGDYIIDPIFDSAGNFTNGVACVSVNGKYGFIDRTGKYVIEPLYGENWSPHWTIGEAFTLKLGEKYALANSACELLTEPIYDKIRICSDGYAVCYENNADKEYMTVIRLEDGEVIYSSRTGQL